jgi:hypothetical protein
MLKPTLASVLFCVLGMFGSNAHADASDGRWWKQRTPAEKLSYVVGFWAGVDYSAEMLDVAATKALDPKKFDPERLQAVLAVVKGTNGAVNDQLRNVSAGQVVAGIDSVYGDYRNQGISVDKVMYVVFYAIKGGSDASVAATLEARRKEAAK